MRFSKEEILETIRMVALENLDIRTVTMGIALHHCADSDESRLCTKVYDQITGRAANLVQTADQLAAELGIPITNKRISVTPISTVAAPCNSDSYVPIGKALDRAAANVGVDFIGGFSALVYKGFSRGDRIVIDSLAEALSTTKHLCGSVAVADTRAGINMDAVYRMAQVIKDAAERTAAQGGVACAKLVVFANAVEDSPFMAGAFHGYGEGECVINVGISGPGVIQSVVEKMPDADLGGVAEAIKRTAFKITRMGELVGREMARRLGVAFGIVDLSLAPTAASGDSVSGILEAMGLELAGAHGSTAALAMLNDAVKKGGAMASSYVGGLSGAFIPVSEDDRTMFAAARGALSIEKLEAMTSVCSVGLDMIAVPGDTSVETLAAIIADEMAIGVINDKTTAVRIIPVPGKGVGDWVEYGGLLGKAPVMAVSRFSADRFVKRGGRIPPPVTTLGN
jgi:hypothetical protein